MLTGDTSMRWISAAIVTVLASVADAGTREPGTPDSRHVAYGEGFKCVLKIEGRGKDGTKSSASCVAIAPRWVVTAAHVVEDCDEWWVYVGGKAVPLSKVVMHDEFRRGGVGWHDIAVAKTSEDIGLDHYPALYGYEDEQGKICSIAGWGLEGTLSTGATKVDGKRRAGSNTVDRAERGVIVCSVVGGTRTELEWMIAPGDSGGGLFIDGKLAGVNSFMTAIGKAPRSTYGDESHHTRISLYREWIHGHALRHVAD
jgi:hypothetical protein